MIYGRIYNIAEDFSTTSIALIIPDRDYYPFGGWGEMKLTKHSSFTSFSLPTDKTDKYDGEIDYFKMLRKLGARGIYIELPDNFPDLSDVGKFRVLRRACDEGRFVTEITWPHPELES
jgi:hypothetical protein